MNKEPEIVSAIVEMYSSGKEQKEIVEATGQSYSVVSYWLKKKGIFNPERRQHGSGIGFREYSKVKEQEAESRLAFLLLEKGFFYIGKAEKERRIILSCLVCGGSFERYNDRHFRESTIECPICTAKVKEQKERERQTVRNNRKVKELEKIFVKELDRMITQNEPHYCKECGKKFTLKGYAESEGIDTTFLNNSVFCSSECRKKYDRKITRRYNKTHGKHQKRAIKFGVGFDKTISLTELIKRNGTRCAICGGTCDLTDYEVINGVWIYGNNYPSIDHIKPMSKGGNHSWENVQVAHRLCNSRKGANVV